MPSPNRATPVPVPVIYMEQTHQTNKQTNEKYVMISRTTLLY